MASQDGNYVKEFHLQAWLGEFLSSNDWSAPYDVPDILSSGRTGDEQAGTILPKQRFDHLICVSQSFTQAEAWATPSHAGAAHGSFVDITRPQSPILKHEALDTNDVRLEESSDRLYKVIQQRSDVAHIRPNNQQRKSS